LDELKTGRFGREVSLTWLFSLYISSSLDIIEYNEPDGTRFGDYHGLRVMKAVIMQAMRDVAQETEIQINYGDTGLVLTRVLNL
jgi:hypothetical protein